jgi:hypothetical protein
MGRLASLAGCRLLLNPVVSPPAIFRARIEEAYPMTGKDRRWLVRAGRQEPGHDHAHESGNGHSHGLSTDADRRYLVIALCLLGAFMLGEVIVAFASGSLAVGRRAHAVGRRRDRGGAVGNPAGRPPSGRILDVRLEAG